MFCYVLSTKFLSASKVPDSFFLFYSENKGYTLKTLNVFSTPAEMKKALSIINFHKNMRKKSDVEIFENKSPKG